MLLYFCVCSLVLLFRFTICKPIDIYYVYTYNVIIQNSTYLWVLGAVIFATFVNYHSLIWVTVSSSNVCSLAVTLPLFDPAGVYCSIIISMVTGCNSINRRLSSLYDQEAAGELWRLIFQQYWDPATFIDILISWISISLCKSSFK